MYCGIKITISLRAASVLLSGGCSTCVFFSFLAGTKGEHTNVLHLLCSCTSCGHLDTRSHRKRTNRVSAPQPYPAHGAPAQGNRYSVTWHLKNKKSTFSHNLKLSIQYLWIFAVNSMLEYICAQKPFVHKVLTIKMC